MTMDELLVSAGFRASVANRMVEDFAANSSGMFYERSRPVCFSVDTPDPDESPGYTMVRFTDHPVMLLTGVAVKSDALDIDITLETTPAECDSREVDEVAFAYHGNGILIENSYSAVYFSAIATERGADKMSDQLVNEIKSLLFAMKTGDPELVFECLRRLSAAKQNVVAENTKARPRIKRTEYTLVPLEL